jgi:glycosyltransferase involved in cell wall biosynthesis
MNIIKPSMDFMVLSHLRWDFVYQRPQHLLSRCARENRVWFWEEPRFVDGIEPRLQNRAISQTLTVVCPELPAGTDEQSAFRAQEKLLSGFMSENAIDDYILWYYTPVARNFTRQLSALAVVYDCMDELSAFRGAPPGLRAAEADLFQAADVVFTGGRSLYESKRSQHPAVYCFPSSIDTQHFAQARVATVDPADQDFIAHPRVGYCGVIDERMDLELLAGVAQKNPDLQFVMIGPVVKISESDLPRSANIHYLGGKSYQDLPQYMAGWDVAMLPFARNESTRFISPTKTPEYLAAGLPAVSTSITDVVRPYGEQGLVEIADTPDDFSAAIRRCLDPTIRERLRPIADRFLSTSSWDTTWKEMEEIVYAAAGKNRTDRTAGKSVVGMSTVAD